MPLEAMIPARRNGEHPDGAVDEKGAPNLQRSGRVSTTATPGPERDGCSALARQAPDPEGGKGEPSAEALL